MTTATVVTAAAPAGAAPAPKNCDGKMHTERFTVDQVEGKAAWDTLAKGDGWVQFCLFDDTTPMGDGETDFGQPVSSMEWLPVR